MYLSHSEAFGLWSAAGRQRRVLLAVMLRNIRTRFFGNGLGYLIAIAWPLSHILILVAILGATGRVPPYGNSLSLFVATGTVPFMIFSYLSRFMMYSVVLNRPLLSFPEVKVLDLLFASAILELLAASCVTIILIVIGWQFDVPLVPYNITQAAYAFGAAILLGVGFGVLNGVIALAVPVWLTANALITIVLWFTAGVYFVPDSMPEKIRAVLAYHPVLQLIEWTRSAYYEGYGGLILDRSYAIEFGVGSLFLGLALERAMRGHLLSHR
jgi:capsular polysaccharide transport system permease protein